MLPKSYIIAKWVIYSLATLVLFALQHMILGHITILGVTPFLYPMIPALVSSYEGLRQGSVFALVVGTVCDLLIIGPFEGFFAITFTLIGIFAAQIGENILSPGWLCGLVVSLMALGINSVSHFVLYFLAGERDLLLMVRIVLIECAITLPVIFLMLPLYRRIHRRCAVDY